MILVYCMLAMVISLPLLPLLYFKTVYNQIYIWFYNRRQEYRGQNTIHLVLAIVANPFVILISLLIDLLSLPSILLKDDK